MRDTDVNKPAFLWSGLCILLPLLLLTGLGLYFLRQDRFSVRQEANQRSSTIARFLLKDIGGVILTAGKTDSAISSIEFDNRANLVAIAGVRSRASDTSCPEPRLRSAAQDQYELALRDNNLSLVRMFATNRGDLTDTGVPIWLLAQLHELRLNPSSQDMALMLCSNSVNYPSFITPSILAQAPPPFGPAWLAVWRQDEFARELFQSVKSNLSNEDDFWTRWHGQDWLLWRSTNDRSDDSDFFLFNCPFDTLSNSVLAVLHSDESKIPPYAAADVEVAGRHLFAQPTNLETLAVFSIGNPVRSMSDPHFDRRFIGVRLLLAKPSLLYEQQRARTLWFIAIILTSALSALAALFSINRSFRQQVRLSEMKTNFVSSVSHELRAPIASMRLLAEGLDRGKITDPPKQKEYYKLLSQESRRLSTLIENILDYSRIDQNRKIYEIQPTDLPALVHQTIALLSPAAADRRVFLVAPPSDALADSSVVCDGLAIQQALINLLDNAIKHSPPDAAVTIGLERANGSISLSVEDHGPGVPANEREKIFERFYRRGTELRRETQGIGIGLTIVKHIIEAHDGRVIVSDAPGSGARFTVQWPA